MIVRLPFPVPGLFPNRKAGKHWAATQASKVEARETAWALTRAAKGAWIDPGGLIPLSMVFVAPDGRRRDMDGMLSALKPALDGLALALGVDDVRFRPLTLDYERGTAPGGVIVAVGVRI